MANSLYPKGAEGILDESIPLSSGDIRFALIDTGTETYNSADEDMADISVGGDVARMATGLASKTFTGGVFDAADPTINSVSGNSVEAVLTYLYNASDANARLINWIDTPTINLTPNGSNVTVQIDPSGLFSIA